jgi:pheromone shutdown protein TraB
MVAEIILVGTSHVFKIQDAVQNLIRKENPSVVTVELDSQRAETILSTDIKKTQNQNFLYAILAKAQYIIARKFDTQPGQEMVAAIKTAQSMSIHIVAIDMDASLIVKRIWSTMAFKRKVQLMFSILFSLMIKKKTIEKEIQLFEDNPEEQLNLLEANMPEIKHILIDERNEYMAKNILAIASKEEKMMVFVGEGHIPGLMELLEQKNSKLQIIHLNQLLGTSSNKPA